MSDLNKKYNSFCFNTVTLGNKNLKNTSVPASQKYTHLLKNDYNNIISKEKHRLTQTRTSQVCVQQLSPVQKCKIRQVTEYCSKFDNEDDETNKNVQVQEKYQQLLQQQHSSVDKQKLVELFSQKPLNSYDVENEINDRNLTPNNYLNKHHQSLTKETENKRQQLTQVEKKSIKHRQLMKNDYQRDILKRAKVNQIRQRCSLINKNNKVQDEKFQRLDYAITFDECPQVLREQCFHMRFRRMQTDIQKLKQQMKSYQQLNQLPEYFVPKRMQ